MFNTLEQLVERFGGRDGDLVSLRRRAAERLDGTFVSFLHVPKTGGSSFKHAFSEAMASSWSLIDLHVDDEDQVNWAACMRQTHDRTRLALAQWGSIIQRRFLFHHHRTFELARELINRPTITIIREPRDALLSGYYWAKERYSFVGELEQYFDSLLEGDLNLPFVIQTRALSRMLGCTRLESPQCDFGHRSPSWIMTLEDFRINSRVAEAAKFALGVDWQVQHYPGTKSIRSESVLSDKDERFLTSTRLVKFMQNEVNMLFDLYARQF